MTHGDVKQDKGLTADGKPRRRSPGGGRPPKHGEETRSIRVPKSIPTELCSSIPELQAILDSWEEKAASEPNSPRYHYLKEMIVELRALGY
jgi:hypothetical protein